MESVRGYIEHITFRNEENGYTVLTLSDPEREKKGEDCEFIAVGSLPDVGAGELLELNGIWTVHPTYGDQFKFESFSILPPENAAAIERYLGSGTIRGVREKLAHRIVARFGDATLRILDESPERLSEIRGITPKMARDIAEQIFEKKDQRDGMLFLAGYHIPNALALRIWKQYGPDIYAIVRDNPYRLAEEVKGVGFLTADEMAQKSGIRMDSRFRISSAILYVLELASGDGSIFLPRDVLLRRTSRLLGFPGEEQPAGAQGYEEAYGVGWGMQAFGRDAGNDHPGMSSANAVPGNIQGASLIPDAFRGAKDPVVSCLLDLSVEKKVVCRSEDGQDRVYLKKAYYAEQRVARMLRERNLTIRCSREKARNHAVRAASESGFELDERQLEAVIEAQRSCLMILTGGPGTGKTTTINTMIRVFEEQGLDIELAAPTGRAAKRMKEATGRAARTIHRLLEVNGDPESGTFFNKDESEPLEADVIFIDEMSMVDLYLFQSLLRAVVPGTRLVMVGDANQLPSVGPGRVLSDMILSGQIRVVTLEKIFRQALMSDIVVNAHKINAGEYPVISNKSPDFFFIRELDPATILGTVVKLVRDNLPRYLKTPSADIQVLSPMKKGLLGVKNLNQVMQNYLNPATPGKNEHSRGDTLFREGDRVMQVRNNYQIAWTVRGRHGAAIDAGEGVFNGDMGIIKSIHGFAKILTVEFDEHRYVEYDFEDLDQLELAYAITVHKAQGSEYPAVVIPLLRGPRMLMNRNVLYTAVTRAKQMVVLVGDPLVMNEMIDNLTEAKRYTSLDLRISQSSQAAEEKEKGCPDAGGESGAGGYPEEGMEQDAGNADDDGLYSGNDFEPDPDDPFSWMD